MPILACPFCNLETEKPQKKLREVANICGFFVLEIQKLEKLKARNDQKQSEQ